jgi:endonuclease/exonuclease/phosphatase family metal-dependent hydrolase
MGWLRRDSTLEGIREAIRRTDADIVLLQEVLGHHRERARQSQFEFLADQVWNHYAYAQNAVYPDGHHGNAILSKFPVQWWENQDISMNLLEHRGCLHAIVETGAGPVHVLNVHLNLLHRDRVGQRDLIIDRVRRRVPAEAPLILAGDFNDWRRQMGAAIESELNAIDVFRKLGRESPPTFPSVLPVFSLDRIYVRHLSVCEAHCHRSGFWQGLSDHAALSSVLEQ